MNLPRRRLRFLLPAVLLIVAAAPAADLDRHVVVISIDGFPADQWREPDLPVPTLRRLATEGASAERMTVTTPASTWSSHTSMITSRTPRGHGVFFNGQVVLRGPGRAPVLEQWADKVGFVRVPTLYDVAHAAGLTTAETDWVAVTRAPTITWSFAEVPRADGPVEREMIAAGLLTREQVGWMQHRAGRKSIVWHDEMWTKAACFILEHHRPNLLLHHTLTTDSNHHRYGPGSDAGYAALAHADRLVGDVLDAIERAGLTERTTVIIMTDHGFKPVTQAIHLNVAFSNAGLAHAAGPTLAAADVAALSAGGTAFVYVTDRARRAELLPRVRALLEAIPGIAAVRDGHEGPALGLPTPAEDERMGDLIVIAADGYYFHDAPIGDTVVRPVVNYAATHGYPARDPALDGIFIAHGRGIRPGVVLPRVTNLDLAPTIARLLDLTLPEAEGRVLEEILTPDR